MAKQSHKEKCKIIAFADLKNGHSKDKLMASAETAKSKGDNEGYEGIVEAIKDFEKESQK